MEKVEKRRVDQGELSSQCATKALENIRVGCVVQLE